MTKKKKPNLNFDGTSSQTIIILTCGVSRFNARCLNRKNTMLALPLSVSFSQQNIVSLSPAAQVFKSKGTSRTTASDYLYGCDRARLCFSILLAITLSAVSVTANRAAAAKLNIAPRRFRPSPIYFFFFCLPHRYCP